MVRADGLSSTATLRCVVLQSAHSQEWLCYSIIGSHFEHIEEFLYDVKSKAKERFLGKMHASECCAHQGLPHGKVAEAISPLRNLNKKKHHNKNKKLPPEASFHLGCGLMGVVGGSRSEGRSRRPSPQSPKGILGASSLLQFLLFARCWPNTKH
jgi:hypothetical protein